MYKPLSPHLSIYKPQISSVLSIMHRITGVVNFIGLVLMSWVLVVVVSSPENPQNGLLWQIFSTNFGLCVLIMWSFSLFVHMSTGVRHLAWDAGYGFELKTMKNTGYAAVFAAVLLTVITWTIILIL